MSPRTGSAATTNAYDALNRRIRAALEEGSAWYYEYNDRDEIVSARHAWSDFTPVTGQQFEYSYDPVGNRTTAKSGGDVNGANLRASSYAVNSLNQYSWITIPGYEWMSRLAWVTSS
jgi:YD repeat-containing protein